LVDGIHGEPEVFGSWQGFQGTDMEVVLDLGESRKISGITTGFLQQYPSWIWLPVSVKYELSDNGSDYRTVHEQRSGDSADTPGSFVRKFDSGSINEKARYIRITAINRKTCPEWHPGAGHPSWIFADEIQIR
jgi:hexosaminidase